MMNSPRLIDFRTLDTWMQNQVTYSTRSNSYIYYKYEVMDAMACLDKKAVYLPFKVYESRSVYPDRLYPIYISELACI